MGIQLSLEDICRIFAKAGVERMLAKPLVQNDNVKQQIYLGESFTVLNEIPFGEVSAEGELDRPNFKAPVDFFWLDQNHGFQKALGTKLILYPDYPEVRLSGFVRGCSAAPSEFLRPVPLELRGEKNAWDGRVLFLGITREQQVLGFLGEPRGASSVGFEKLRVTGLLPQTGPLYILPAPAGAAPTVEEARRVLLYTLTDIAAQGWINSQRRDAAGNVKPYKARNGGGYTLEALLGIAPNSRSEPDFLGWEIKAFSDSRVTLMTPEPNGGYYGEEGVQAFLNKYGRVLENDVIYFTGTHRVGVRNETSGHLLELHGFDQETGKIDDVNGGILLKARDGEVSASWSYAALIKHWARKHAQAAYVRCERDPRGDVRYRYPGPVLLGTGTDFGCFLTALSSGAVIYDPAPKLTGASTAKPLTKARSQFRILVKNLPKLYHTFVVEEVCASS